MPTEQENVQYLYLVLTNGSQALQVSDLAFTQIFLLFVCIYALLAELTFLKDGLGRSRGSPGPQEGRSHKALVPPQEGHGRWRSSRPICLQVPLAVHQAFHSRQGQ